MSIDSVVSMLNTLRLNIKKPTGYCDFELRRLELLNKSIKWITPSVIKCSKWIYLVIVQQRKMISILYCTIPRTGGSYRHKASVRSCHSDCLECLLLLLPSAWLQKWFLMCKDRWVLQHVTHIHTSQGQASARHQVITHCITVSECFGGLYNSLSISETYVSFSV